MRWIQLAGLMALLGGCEVVREVGADCSGAVICGDGLSCVDYFDVAGKERFECFDACQSDRNCDEDQECAIFVMDGPSGVCSDLSSPE